MPVEISDAEPPVSEQRLAAVEQRFGIVLPAEYRSWLLRYNGGHPTPNRFRYKGRSGPYTDGAIAWFLAVYDGPHENFERKFEAMKVLKTRLPAELIPIARDGFGNLVSLAIDGPKRGKVYFWDHEEEGDEPGYDNCHLVADTFDEFIAGLH